jgi:hypothetical protein
VIARANKSKKAGCLPIDGGGRGAYRGDMMGSCAERVVRRHDDPVKLIGELNSLVEEKIHSFNSGAVGKPVCATSASRECVLSPFCEK